MIEIPTRQVECPVCKAQPGEKCTYLKADGRIGQFMFTSHEVRRIEAARASAVANILVE